MIVMMRYNYYIQYDVMDNNMGIKDAFTLNKYFVEYYMFFGRIYAIFRIFCFNVTRKDRDYMQLL